MAAEVSRFDDNYADGKAADVWDLFIGDIEDRLVSYKDALCKLLREAGAKRVLDLACGTGPDSIMLVQEGFQVTSVDASDKMLKHALNTRWDRRKEPNFDNWVIREANWLTLVDDLHDILDGGFDAAICLGNSFSHVVDMVGDKKDQKTALINFKKVLKPGGLLIMDHRNYDDFQEGGLAPAKSIYYHIKGKTDIKTTLHSNKNGTPQFLQYDYTIEPSKDDVAKAKKPTRTNFYFRLYPHKFSEFKLMLLECFDKDSKHLVLGDYKPLKENSAPGYFVHTITRGMSSA